MDAELMTADEAEKRRLAALAIESDDLNVVQVEILYRTKWTRFEINILEVQHLPPSELWDRYLAKALNVVGAPDRVIADPVIPEASQAGAADIGVVDSVN